MKKITILALAVVGILSSSMAIAQSSQMDQDTMAPKMPKMAVQSMSEKMMMGLSASEKKIAKAHMKHMTMAERAVMMKKCGMCMIDKHEGMVGMKMDKKMQMDHMMSGLSRSEQTTMKKMWSKMTPKQMAVAKKMMMSCCKHGRRAKAL